jgi:hypothetical protein
MQKWYKSKEKECAVPHLTGFLDTDPLYIWSLTPRVQLHRNDWCLPIVLLPGVFH